MRNFFNRVILFSAALACAAFSAEPIAFVPSSFGEVNQGEVKHLVLKGANLSGKEIKLETVMCQGTGCSNFKFPTAIAHNSGVVIEFDQDFSDKEGPVSAVVVLVDTEGRTYSASVDGVVKAPFFFSDKMFDAGYYGPGEKREWSFYVWETDKKNTPDLTLSKESTKDFVIKTKKVKVNVDENGKVTEGGKVPALKITLSTKNMSREGWELKQKSIRKIVAFKSKKYPKATPEVLIIGFWK
ncbi:MAG: hypothetical protein HUK20_02310 [Fibrobacter sp.]|nr:hypothetical protein [Fibrobacter sp.]